MAAMYPRTESLPGVEDCEPEAFVDRFAVEASRLVYLGVLFGSLCFQLCPLITIGIPLPAAWLPSQTRDRYAHQISSHPLYHLRQLMFLVKFAAGMCWGAHPSVRERLAMAPYPADPGTWRTS